MLLISNQQLFSIGKFEFRLQHLLIIGILSVAFTMSFLVRSQALDYGFELNEFDPFFNYRATQFIVDNGIIEYFDWRDDRSWHPYGRNISSSSQVMLHITASSLYQIFSGGTDLYSFTIMFPVVIGSLTAIVIFALVRVIGGTTAGLFAALFFSLSVPIIIRGMAGWFKSEPLGIFYGLLGVYLFLSGIKSENRKIAFAKLVGGGIILGFGLSSWGGIQFFILPLSLFFLSLPFFRKDHKFILWAIPVFVTSLIITSISFERPGLDFLFGIEGFVLIGTTLFLVVSIYIQKLSKEEKRLRNTFALLSGSIVAGLSVLAINSSSQFLPLPSFRYLNAINPFLITQDPLVDSVAEHATTTINQSFWFLSILMVFAAIGIWLIFRHKTQSSTFNYINNDMTAFALIIGLMGVYISSAFVRLEVFASISIIILSSVGLSIISAEILKTKKLDKKKITQTPSSIIKISFVVVIITLLIIPVTLPGAASWISGIKAPPTLLNGGTNFNIATDDWPVAMEWLKNNTPEDSVVASWWDYGYWITTLGERISLADNATLSTEQIQKIALMFLSSQDSGWQLLQELDADYVLVYVASVRITEKGIDPALYLLQGGGDESKKQWFMRIAGEPVPKYVEQDGISGTDYFWDNTILGKMFPYSLAAYANFDSNLQSETYQPGFTAIYNKDVKFQANGNGPLRLVYSSPGFDREDSGPISGVFIYEVNKDYVPNEIQPEVTETVESIGETAVITTGFGDITIELKENIAPKTVENFKNLANSGFYDGTIFHRIVPDFVIQGGDPNTISGSRDIWGQGGPGYSINAELSDIKHKKYIVSMARGSDVNSAGSQFFIVLGDAAWLDNKYTVFGEVISGHDVVDNIGSLETNSQDQPINSENAVIEKITINN